MGEADDPVQSVPTTAPSARCAGGWTFDAPNGSRPYHLCTARTSTRSTYSLDVETVRAGGCKDVKTLSIRE